MDPRPAVPPTPTQPSGRRRPGHPGGSSSTPARVAQQLRDQITQGRFTPGTRLREEALAESLGVSRSTVREAFAELAADRLLVREPNRGVCVATLTAADVVDIFAARRAIELGAVRGRGSSVIVANARLAVIDGLDAVRQGDGVAAARADRHFHRALVALAASARLNLLIRQLMAELQWVLNANSVSPSLFLTFAQDNKRIHEILVAGDFDTAAQELSELLTRVERDVVTAVLRSAG
jgi:DNA-binding GntR family transcriptional regulator